MEMQFDKEIDAILRKAREPDAVQTNGGGHLDADAIAAFAENAVPLQSRDGMIAHFADCGHCRAVLAKTIEFNAAEAVIEPVASPVVAAIADVPWYRRFLSPQVLAYSMGIFVLAFAGIISYRVIVMDSSDRANVAMVESSANRAPADILDKTAEAQSAANVSSNIAQPTAEAPQTLATPAERTAANSNRPSSVETARGSARAERDQPAVTSSDDTVRENRLTAIAASPPPPPPAPAQTQEKAPAEAESGSKSKDVGSGVALSSRQAESLPNTRAVPPPAAAKRSGPIQSQMQSQAGNTMDEMPPSRTVGGKTFNNRNGVWIDSSYRGQTTINVRRDTDDYRNLDSGLRSIAQRIGGTVVVVWKEKAYRIQ